ncbi:hypothetical protein SK128_017131 [Halocaridina rubra]|uniref:3CxxC-type domain-containing protein n=1 Tax=Halocaridina rubra TaxID=373956 RepID=A0AAN8XTB9_HALRR
MGSIGDFRQKNSTSRKMPVKSNAMKQDLYGITKPAVHEMAAKDNRKSINKNSKVSHRKKGQQSDTDTIKREVNPNKKTPYQGSRRACGRFHCDECDREWFSPHSWANCYQKCKECNGQVYPYVQFPLEKCKRTKTKIPPHPSDLCQKCLKLGYLCVSKFSDPVNSEDSQIPIMTSAKREE